MLPTQWIKTKKKPPREIPIAVPSSNKICKSDTPTENAQVSNSNVKRLPLSCLNEASPPKKRFIKCKDLANAKATKILSKSKSTGTVLLLDEDDDNVNDNKENCSNVVAIEGREKTFLRE